MAAMLDDGYSQAKYIMAEGNYAVVLAKEVCALLRATRATRSISPQSRPCATFRILPVIVDPSHGTGKNFMVTPLLAPEPPQRRWTIVEVH